MNQVVCYMVPGKPKSEMMCRAFASGVRANGGHAVLCDQSSTLLPGAAAFYGVRPHQKHLLDQCMEEGRDWYYIDNAYFDPTRQVYFRITRNRLQHVGEGESDGARFAALKLSYELGSQQGKHILLCPQSDEFMDLFCPQGKDWTRRTVDILREHTDREIRVRKWQADKREWYRTLPEDLEDCHALVTFSSASAITAMMHGVPAFVTAEDSICRPVANTDLTLIESPRMPSAVVLRAWMELVADQQFTVSEIQTGLAWRMLNR